MGTDSDDVFSFFSFSHSVGVWSLFTSPPLSAIQRQLSNWCSCCGCCCSGDLWSCQWWLLLLLRHLCAVSVWMLTSLLLWWHFSLCVRVLNAGAVAVDAAAVVVVGSCQVFVTSKRLGPILCLSTTLHWALVEVSLSLSLCVHYTWQTNSTDATAAAQCRRLRFAGEWQAGLFLSPFHRALYDRSDWLTRSAT